MISLSQTLAIITTSFFGFILLWLERIYSNAPLFGDITAGGDSLLTTLSLLVSAATSPVLALTLTIIASLVAVADHHQRLWWFSAGVLLTGITTSTILKELVMLPRPEYALIQLGSYGFPSTHATVATILCIGGIWITYHWTALRNRKLWMYLLLIGWVIICTSRMTLGVHSISDVLAGVLLGTAVSSVAILLAPDILKDRKITTTEHASN
ncbi:MAG: phosphatase PAP2 family protein [Candidatus Paceibacterota bacterium]